MHNHVCAGGYYLACTGQKYNVLSVSDLALLLVVFSVGHFPVQADIEVKGTPSNIVLFI
jgi:hypothetical protein